MLHMQKERLPLTKTKIIITGLALIGLVAALVYPSILPQSARAQSTSSLQNKISQLEREIEDGRNKVQQYEQEANKLESAIASLNTEIANIQKQIDLTNLKIKRIKNKLVETRKELKKQKAILATSLREHYKTGNLTTIEIFMSSENFSDFFNQKEYLNRVRSSIQESSKKVAALEKTLEEQKNEQDTLLQQQKAQRNVVVSKREEKDELLRQTQGQQAKFEEYTANLVEKREQAEAALAAQLAANTSQQTGEGFTVSVGQQVNKGQVIGYVGSSGYSSGPHTHFILKVNGSYSDPRAQGSAAPADSPALKYGMTWPVPGYTRVTTPFGYNLPCSDPVYGPYPTCKSSSDTYTHTAIDIGTQGVYGVPIVAAASGVVTYANYAGGLGNTVVIEHGSYETWYPHQN